MVKRYETPVPPSPKGVSPEITQRRSAEGSIQKETWNPCQIKLVVGFSRGGQSGTEDVGMITGETNKDSTGQSKMRIQEIKILSFVYRDDLFLLIKKLGIPKKETEDVMRNQNDDTFGLDISANYGERAEEWPIVSVPTSSGSLELIPSEFPTIQRSMQVQESVYRSKDRRVVFKYILSSAGNPPRTQEPPPLSPEEHLRRDVTALKRDLEESRTEIERLKGAKVSTERDMRAMRVLLDATATELEQALARKAGFLSSDPALRAEIQSILEKLKKHK